MDTLPGTPIQDVDLPHRMELVLPRIFFEDLYSNGGALNAGLVHDAEITFTQNTPTL